MNRLPRAYSHAPWHALADGVTSLGGGASSGATRGASIDGVPLDTAALDTQANETESDEREVRDTPAIANDEPDAPSRDRASVLNTLGAILVDLNRLLEGKSREALAQAANDGGWGMVEILPHLRDWEEVHRQRIGLMLTEEAPILECLDDSLWSIEHDYSAQDPLKAVAEFRVLRAALIAAATEFDDDAWSRPAVLDCVGKINVHWVLNDICDRDVIQIAQARDLLV